MVSGHICSKQKPIRNIYTLRILYYTHVPINWIKQRPHFIAEQLSEKYDLTVCYNKYYRQNLLTVDGINAGVKKKKLFILPLARFSLIKHFNRYLISNQLKPLLRKFDLIWLTDARTYFNIRRVANYFDIVYDCMDNLLEFEAFKTLPDLKDELLEAERDLVHKAKIIFSSCQTLKQLLTSRYNLQGKKITVVNNALDPESVRTDLEFKKTNIYKRLSEVKRNGSYILTYIGTISHWFDFELVLDSFRKMENITYCLFGPAEVAIPVHKRIIHFGPTRHNFLFDIMQQSDILVMPFVLTPLIQCVNPVKLYEYIASQKPVVAVRYGESEAFQSFVLLYKNAEEYIELIRTIIHKEIQPVKDDVINQFILENSWENRSLEMIRKLEKVLS